MQHYAISLALFRNMESLAIVCSPGCTSAKINEGGSKEENKVCVTLIGKREYVNVELIVSTLGFLPFGALAAVMTSDVKVSAFHMFDALFKCITCLMHFLSA